MRVWTLLAATSKVTLCLALLACCRTTLAQTVKGGPIAQAPAMTTHAQPPSLLDMPLVSLEQGQRFQQQRQVDPSSLPIKSSLPSAQVSSAAAMTSPNPAAATLGHELPTSRTTPLGFPRADFAIGKTQVTSQGNTAASTSVSEAASGVNQSVVR